MHLIPDTTIRRRMKRRRATDVAYIRLTGMTDTCNGYIQRA
jgi:hypothetical protein